MAELAAPIREKTEHAIAGAVEDAERKLLKSSAPISAKPLLLRCFWINGDRLRGAAGAITEQKPHRQSAVRHNTLVGIMMKQIR